MPKSLYISHGGGPMPLLGDPDHAEMVRCLEEIAERLPRPDALVIVSAHWEEAVPTVTAAGRPSLLYDYYNFPDEAYRIEYPCPGDPALAGQIDDLLRQAGFEACKDAVRGLDHGVFVPLKIMYPDADIPSVELSLLSSLDPSAHIAVGRALRPLSRQNVLIIGSGFSFHNFRGPAFDSLQSQQRNQAFEQWLEQVCCDGQVTEAQRTQALIEWEAAPGARHCHPREEHLLPLHVCYGVGEAACRERFELSIMKKSASMYLW